MRTITNKKKLPKGTKCYK